LSLGAKLFLAPDFGVDEALELEFTYIEKALLRLPLKANFYSTIIASAGFI